MLTESSKGLNNPFFSENEKKPIKKKIEKKI